MCCTGSREAAIIEALLWVRDFETTGRPVRIRYDSKYAAKIADGSFAAKTNLLLARTATKLVAQEQQRNL